MNGEWSQTELRRNEFLAMLAHELRNPLAPIRTASELLPHIIAAGAPRVDATLSVMRRQVGQLTRLVDDLLDVSRITQGRIELRLQTVDLSAIVAQALESAAPLMLERHQTVIQPEGAPALFVEGDSARLVQCVSNLLVNASKFTDRGGEICVRLRQEAADVVVEVRDAGIGISADMLPRVFDLFVQADRSLDRSQGGLGIGLSLVRRLVEMHRGTATARSVGIGCGSTFEIRLPLVPAPAAANSAAGVAQRKRRRILVVDDNRDAADSLSMLLQIQGHEVQTAYDGVEALKVATEFEADLVLLDIGLPLMNGLEVARLLRQRDSAAAWLAWWR
jgi:signal transduction histidine kinase